MLGFARGRGRRTGSELADEVPEDEKISLDPVLTRLQMEMRLVIADFEYNLDRHGNPYGWGPLHGARDALRAADRRLHARGVVRPHPRPLPHALSRSFGPTAAETHRLTAARQCKARAAAARRGAREGHPRKPSAEPSAEAVAETAAETIAEPSAETVRGDRPRHQHHPPPPEPESPSSGGVWVPKGILSEGRRTPESASSGRRRAQGSARPPAGCCRATAFGIFPRAKFPDTRKLRIFAG